MIQKLYDSSRYKKLKKKKYWNLTYKTTKLIVVLLFPLVARYQRKLGTDKKNTIIVSLTTFPARISKVWITIATILNQTYKPKKVILWLAKSQFPDGERGLPKRLLNLKKRGLEIEFCDEDLLSHKKYYYTFQKYPEDYVITIDDDMLYPENCLEQLWETHQKYPKAICCQFAHRITVDATGNILPYSEWESCYEYGTEPSAKIMPVGCGGVLYPPHLLHQEVLNKAAIQRLCPRMDDLWLKAMALKNGIPSVICNEGSLIYYDLPGTRKSGLYHSNVEGVETNDKAMEKIIEEYPEILKGLR